jgi:two-component system phosphate regulon response regulator PhoB
MEKIIQIVEDDNDIRFILELMLTEHGYVLETFENIEAFNDRLHKDDVSLIILDVRLPDGSGIEVCKRLKSSKSTSEIPVLMMSAHANGESIILEGDPDYFIAKPFDIDEYVEKVNELAKLPTIQRHN